MNAELLTVDGLISFSQLYIVPFAINLVLAILVFLVGRWGARVVTRIIGKLLRRADTDESLVKFIGDVVYALLLTIVVIAALERLGIKTTAAVAVIGAAGLAIGLALQGSLGNFASGVLIMLFKPYRVGDTVQIAGKSGVVDSVHIFTTVLHTGDLVKVIIPNGTITANIIENLTALGTRRVAVSVTLNVEGDIDRVQGELARAATQAKGALAEPPPTVSLVEVAGAAVTFTVHVSVQSADLQASRTELITALRRSFGERLASAKPA